MWCRISAINSISQKQHLNFYGETPRYVGYVGSFAMEGRCPDLLSWTQLDVWAANLPKGGDL